jgi:chromosome partitioning protein
MIIALAGQKGGAGKTTTSICLASEWHRRGKSVLLVDADPQGSARTWASVAAEQERSIPTVVAMGAGLHQREQLPRLAQAYDITIIDCPPRHGEIQRAALMVSDMAVLPCGPSALDAWALTETIDIVQQAQIIRPALKAAVLITRKVARTALGQNARDVVMQCGLDVLGAELGYRVAYQEAPAAGIGVVEYDPHGAASTEIQALIAEIELMLGLSSEEAHHVA